MALDAANHRLFIGCRHPSKLLVLDTETGARIAAVDIDNDADDIFYNHEDSSLYITCGGGYLNIIKQQSVNQYTETERTSTSSGARTSLFISQINRLVIASPKGFGRSAELLVYAIDR